MRRSHNWVWRITKKIWYAERGMEYPVHSDLLVSVTCQPTLPPFLRRNTTMKLVAILAFGLAITASAADAATIVNFAGNANPALATGTASITLTGGSITGTLTNTSPNDARITGFGFDIGPGNIAGFIGTPDPITTPAGVNFDFRDDALGNVPQFNSADLDFAYVTGPNPNFAGGFPNEGLAPQQMLTFTVTGPFGVLTEAQIASGLFVRFQQVGPNGQSSDVATPGGDGGVVTPVTPTPVPEPASMLLLGSGLLYLGRRRYNSRNA